MSATSSPAPWAALLPAALSGTRHQPFAPLPGLTPSLGAEAAAADKQLLLTAASLALVQRAGQRPRPGPAEALPPLPPESWPAVPEAAVQGLEDLLAELPTGSDAWRDTPPKVIMLNVLADLRQLHHHLPPRLVLRMLQTPSAYPRDRTTARRVLGTRGRWLHELLGESSAWYHDVVNHDWEALIPQYRFNFLSYWMQYPMQADDSYVAKFTGMPAEERIQLLWGAWKTNGGCYLPPPLQAELDALLAATPPAKRPWTTMLRGLEQCSGSPRLAGHPLLAQLAEWTAPLLRLEQPAGGPPQVRVALPAAEDPAWKEVGLDPLSTYFHRRNKLEFYLQELLYRLGPRHWATAWQLPPAEVVALVAAASRGRLVLEAWSHSLGVLESRCWPEPEPEFARALLALPQHPVPLEWQARMSWHLPPAERAAWFTARLPTNLAAPHEPGWVQLLSHWTVPLDEPPLLPVLAAALVQPRTTANARQTAGLAELLEFMSRWPIEARLYPEVQAALGAVLPLQPKCSRALAQLLRGLALRYHLWQGCGAPSPAAADPGT